MSKNLKTNMEYMKIIPMCQKLFKTLAISIIKLVILRFLASKVSITNAIGQVRENLRLTEWAAPVSQMVIELLDLELFQNITNMWICLKRMKITWICYKSRSKSKKIKEWSRFY